jgi:hypothetical protein
MPQLRHVSRVRGIRRHEHGVLPLSDSLDGLSEYPERTPLSISEMPNASAGSLHQQRPCSEPCLPRFDRVVARVQ